MVEILVPVSDGNATNQNGDTPLILAVKEGNEKIVQLVLPISDAKRTDPYDGETALIYAARWKSEKMVEILIPVSDAKASNNDGETALMGAAKKGNVKSVELLIPVSDIKAINNYGKTALDIAKIIAKSSGNDQIVELLQQQ